MRADIGSFKYSVQFIKRPCCLKYRTEHLPKPAGAVRTAVPAADTSKKQDRVSVSQEELKSFFENTGKIESGLLRSRVQSLAQALKTDLQKGLKTDAADLNQRRKNFGANRLKPLPPVSFFEVLLDALDDFTLLILIGSGALSLLLEYSVAPGGEYGWLEGTAILLSVAVVLFVTSVTNFQKEIKFRELSALNEDVKVESLTVKGNSRRVEGPSDA